MSTDRDLYEEAARRGLHVVEATEEFIALDIDQTNWVASPGQAELMQILEDAGVVRPPAECPVLVTTSQHGNRHVYIPLRRGLSTAARIAVQACLGSDPKRELLSIMRDAGYRDRHPPSAMFETDEEIGKVRMWIEDRRKEFYADADDRSF